MIHTVSGPLLAPTAAAAATTLPVSYVTQLPYSDLCWAACCAMLLAANGRAADLKTIAAAVTGQPCSNDPDNSNCNRPLDPASALAYYQLQTDETSDGALDAEDLRRHVVEQRKPVQIWWLFTGNLEGGHVALVTGYDPPSESWCLLDPKKAPCWVTFEVLQTYFNQARVYRTFYGIGNALG
jgi:hypothetical protein